MDKSPLSTEEQNLIKLNIEKFRLEGFTFDNFYIKEAGKNIYGKDKGLGVFTRERISEGVLFGYFPMSFIGNRKLYLNIYNNPVKRYAHWAACMCENCQKNGARGFIASIGVFINSPDSKEDWNCHYYVDRTAEVLILKSIKNIEANQEILTWYGQHYYDKWCT
jgi:hypothetical protein